MSELEQLKILQAKLDAEKSDESKGDPHLKQIQEQIQRKQAESESLAKQMEHLSLPDYGQIKQEEIRDKVVCLLKSCWSLNDTVENEQKKLEG